MALTKITDKQVTYKQGATGSAVRGLGDKLREFPSVLDFGASTAALAAVNTAAFNAAYSASAPRAVEVLPGTYAISGTVTGKFYSFGVVTITGGTVNTITNLVP